MEPISTGMALIAGVGNALFNKNQRKEEMERAHKLQMEGNREMAAIAKQNSMDIWNATNYEAQMQHLKNAGLNPALLYGQSGGGGATTGSGAAGSVGMQQAGNYDALSGVQLGLMNAQKEVLQSQAKKNEAEAKKIGGVDTEETKKRIENLSQGIENAKAQELLTKATNVMQGIQNEIAEAGKEIEVQKIFWGGEQALNALQQSNNETYISNETYKHKVEQIALQTTMMAIENEAKKAGIALTKEQTRNIQEQIRMQDAKIDIEAFEAGIKAQNVSLWDAIGGEVKRTINNINHMTEAKGGYQTYHRKDR